MSTARRVFTIVLALIAAAGFALAVEGGRWWTIGQDASIGPVSSQHCFAGDCMTKTLDWTGGSDSWQRAGVATQTGGLCAALVLIALAGAVAARRAGRLAAAVGVVAVVTATAAATAFYLMRPTIERASVGRGAIVFALAVVVAALAIASTLARPRATP